MKLPRSLRWRLTLLLGIGVSALWLVLASLLLLGVRNQMEQTLDSRLAASAQMVASLIERRGPAIGLQPSPAGSVMPRFPAALACRVSTVSGAVVAESHNAPGDALDQAPPGYSFQEVAGERWRVFSHQQGELSVATAERMATRTRLMMAVVLAAALPFALALAGTLALVWLGIRRGFDPLHRLGAHVAGRASHDLQPLAWDDAPAEIRPLLDEINRLLKRVDDAMQRERRFSGDAAHELRTPLTAIRTHLQVARMTEGQRAEHAVNQAARAAERMQATLEQLLLLARIESNAAFENSARASARDIAEAACQELSAHGAAGNIVLHAEAGPPVLVAAPAALVSVALRNLLDNAQRFSPQGEPVELTLRHEPEQVLFVVRDRGPGAAAESLERLANRFVTAGPYSGSGLGLAIVDTIATRFGGELMLRNAEPGFEAVLRMPREGVARTGR